MTEKLGPFKVEYLIIENQTPRKTALLLNPPRKFWMPVAGTSFRQPDVKRAATRGSKGMADLWYEDDNRHDHYAVAVFIRGLHCGYIPREWNKQFRVAMRFVIPPGMYFVPLRCPMAIIGGGTDKNLGIRLDLPKSKQTIAKKSLKKSRTSPVRCKRLRLPEEFN